MARLENRDYERLCRYLLPLYSLRDTEGYIDHVLRTIPNLIGSEIVSFNTMNAPKGRIQTKWSPEHAHAPESLPVLASFIHQHPVVAHMHKTGDGRSRKISDFLTRNQFHRLELYNEYYRQSGMKYFMGFALSGTRSRVIGFQFSRALKDFGERERVMMDLLRPHIAQAYGNAHLIDRLEHHLEQAGQIQNAPEQGVMEIGPRGRVRWATPRARELCERYWPSHERTQGRLPEPLRVWAESEEAYLANRYNLCDPPGPLVIDGTGGRLTVRMLRDGRRRMLFLDEAAVRQSPAGLLSLGLSKREAEVLEWIARGKTNAEIGAILGISTRTVQKHLERSYVKLGIESRTAAAAIVLGRESDS